MIGWRDMGLELARGLAQASIEFQYLGDFGRITRHRCNRYGSTWRRGSMQRLPMAS